VKNEWVGGGAAKSATPAWGSMHLERSVIRKPGPDGRAAACENLPRGRVTRWRHGTTAPTAGGRNSVRAVAPGLTEVPAGGTVRGPPERLPDRPDQSVLEATDAWLPSPREEAEKPACDSPRRDPKNTIASYPTLRQAWSGECPRPQCAFKMSMFNVSCNSH
jgi:hypothetical protein